MTFKSNEIMKNTMINTQFVRLSPQQWPIVDCGAAK